jgi:vWA found in TerF C terminus
MPDSSSTTNGVVFTKGEECLGVDTRKRLNMRKQEVVKVLLTKEVHNVEAEVLLVLDCTGSMRKIYPQLMRVVVERVVAVASQLNPSGVMPAWRFAESSARTPDLELAHLEEWLTHCVAMDPWNGSTPATITTQTKRGLFGRNTTETVPNPAYRTHVESDRYPALDYVGFKNDETKPIADVVEYLDGRSSELPLLVLFFSDGGVKKHSNEAIKQALLATQLRPVFWQFVGIGTHQDYGVLEHFDTMTGREIDNIGFFSLDNIANISDRGLYELLLGEFPSWLKTVRERGIVAS